MSLISPGDVTHGITAFEVLTRKGATMKVARLALVAEGAANSVRDAWPQMRAALLDDIAKVRATNGAETARSRLVTHASEGLAELERVKNGLPPSWPTPSGMAPRPSATQIRVPLEWRVSPRPDASARDAMRRAAAQATQAVHAVRLRAAQQAAERAAQQAAARGAKRAAAQAAHETTAEMAARMLKEMQEKAIRDLEATLRAAA